MLFWGYVKCGCGCCGQNFCGFDKCGQQLCVDVVGVDMRVGSSGSVHIRCGHLISRRRFLVFIKKQFKIQKPGTIQASARRHILTDSNKMIVFA